MPSKVAKAVKILRTEGPMSLLEATKEYIEWRFLPDSANEYQSQRIQGTKQRWEMIEQRLTTDDHSLLDIGCNIGELTSNAAEFGLLAFGMETNSESVRIARESHKIEGASFMQYTLTPDNIHKLPETDVIFVLSVYHYWYREHGSDRAEELLTTLGEKANSKLFFEPASRQERYKRTSDVDITPPPIENLNKESIVDHNTNLLNRALGDEYEIELLGGTPRGDDEEGSRYLFLCEKIS